MRQWDKVSTDRRKGVHPDLLKLADAVLQAAPWPLRITEGMRTLERQKQLLAAKATKTLNSRHLTGHAVDLMATVDGAGRWDWGLYPTLAAVVQQAASDLGVPIVWGGSWPRFRDGPHFELDRKRYP